MANILLINNWKLYGICIGLMKIILLMFQTNFNSNKLNWEVGGEESLLQALVTRKGCHTYGCSIALTVVL